MAERAKLIDVSRWQGSINFKAVKRDGVDGVIFKLTEGLDFVDPLATVQRYREIHAAGLMCGGYGFARPQAGRDARAEAEFLVQVAKRVGFFHPGDLPLALDLEWTELGWQDTERFANRYLSWLSGLDPHLSGQLVYSYVSFLNSLTVAPDSALGKSPLWLAHYTGRPLRADIPAPWATRPGRLALHQYTSSGRVAGVAGRCDVNASPLTAAGFRERFALGRTETRKPAPKPAPPVVRPPASPHYPAWLPARHRRQWDRPWSLRARNGRTFKRLLLQHGYLSPHFTLAEARCKDGTDVPAGKLRDQAQDHAFQLERLRHRLGDIPIVIISWYRTRTHNARVGGASQSHHLNAWATDHPREWVDHVGRSKVLAQGGFVFRTDGMGVYPSGAMHFDNRGWRARWSSF